jgi:uncharacterized membrane protein (UPF0127 family)
MSICLARTVVLACGLLLGSGLGAAGCKNSQRMSPGASAAQAAPAQVSVSVAPGRDVAFRVELARTSAEREQGLMYRTQMASDAGMLFIFEQSSELVFWMKNTLIPLDMIFIGRDRRVVGIVENAQPETLTARRVDGLAQFVLEINGGLSAKMGIQPGAMVTFNGIPGS